MAAMDTCMARMLALPQSAAYRGALQGISRADVVVAYLEDLGLLERGLKPAMQERAIRRY